MKNLNYKIILLSFFLTTILLFGGWYSIKYVNSEKPVTDWIAMHETMELVSMKTEQKKIFTEIRYEQNPYFGQSYLQLVDKLQQLAKQKEVEVVISPERSEQHPWWLSHSMEVIQLMEHQQYTAIPTLFQQWKEEGSIAEGTIQMNNDYIFIYLEPHGQPEIYLVFTRQLREGEVL